MVRRSCVLVGSKSLEICKETSIDYTVCTIAYYYTRIQQAAKQSERSYEGFIRRQVAYIITLYLLMMHSGDVQTPMMTSEFKARRFISSRVQHPNRAFVHPSLNQV